MDEKNVETSGAKANDELKYKRILNLSLWDATFEQRELGVIDPLDVCDVEDEFMRNRTPLALIHQCFVTGYGWEELFRRDVINFLHTWRMPGRAELNARYLANIAASVIWMYGATYALIGGVPIFMPYLEEALYQRGIIPVYAHMERVLEWSVGIKGQKYCTNYIKHHHFYEARPPHRVLERLTETEERLQLSAEELELERFMREEMNRMESISNTSTSKEEGDANDLTVPIDLSLDFL